MTAHTSPPDKKELYIPLLFSLLLGFLFLLPSLLMPLLQKDPASTYSPLIATSYAVEETVYASGIREIFDGRFWFRDSQVYENKELPSPYVSYTFPFLVLGLFAKLLGSLPLLLIVCDFFLPAIIFLLVYYFIFKLSRDVWIGTLGGVMLLIGYHFVPYVPFMMQAIPGQLINYGQGLRPILRFSRLPFSQFSFIVLISSTILTYLALTEEKKRYLFLAGIVSGLSFYTYFYYWTFIGAAYGVMFLFFFFQKNKESAIRIASILSVMMLISIPSFIASYEFSQVPHMPQVVSRFGIQVKPIILIQIMVLIQVIMYLAVSWAIVRPKDLRFYFFISFLIGSLLCYYIIPFVLGYGVQIFHWSSTALDPFLVMFIVFCFFAISESRYLSAFARKLATPFIRYQKGISIAIILFLLTFGFYTHIRFSIIAHSLFVMPNKLLESYEWLNNNTEKDAVVASNSAMTISLLPTYTHCNNYLPNAGYMCTSSVDEVIQRMAIAYKIFEVSEEYLEAAMAADRHEDIIPNFLAGTPSSVKELELAGWGPTFFGAKFAFGPWNQTNTSLPITNPKPYNFPPEIKEKIKKQFTLFVPFEERAHIRTIFEKYQKEKLHSLLEEYRIDYLYYGPYEKEISQPDFSQYDFLKRVYNQEGVEIYQVQK